MKVCAPGKLLLSGAYAVLEGAPAIVLAVARYAVADSERVGPARGAEARAAFGDDLAPTCDTSEMYIGGKKIGIGSSAAALVSALGAAHAAKGADLEEADVRAAIFREARRAHATAQSGGSGVDVAASTYGGVLRYEIPDGAGSTNVRMAKCSLPTGLHVDAWFTGESARTSDLLSIVGAFRDRDAAGYRRCMSGVADASHAVADAIERASAYAVVHSCRRMHAALSALGDASSAPIVPPAVAELGVLAHEAGDAFYVSGAGGGDVALYVSLAPASESFRNAATERGFRSLALVLDRRGLHRAVPVASASSARAS